MLNYICDNQKYTFNDKSLAISLSVVNLNFKKEIFIGDKIFVLKEKFHVTLFPIGQIIKKNNITINDFQNLILEDFCQFIKFNNIDLIKYSDEFRFVEENDLRSIVIMCEVLNLDKFFELINKKYNLNIEISSTHVTLYTLPGKSGIFIIDSEDLKLKTKIINFIKFLD